MFERNDLDEFTLRFIQKTVDFFSTVSDQYFIYLSKLKTYFSEFSNNYIFSRIRLEITDIHEISSGLINSIGKTGQLILGLTFVFLIFFVLVFISKPSDKKSSDSLPKDLQKRKAFNNTKRRETNRSRENLMKIELQLLELQDQFHRGVISHQSYVDESLRIGSKVK